MFDVVVVGGGAAGYFAALRAASEGARAAIVEGTARPLQKVRISGGGRCNVTHACFTPKELVKHYPRGGRELLGPFHRFGPEQTIEWFESRGVSLKVEPDGRMFPVTDNSETIIDCLEQERAHHGVRLFANRRVTAVRRHEGDRFVLEQARGESIVATTVVLAAGGGAQGASLARELGHTIEPLVPSLFAFEIDHPALRELSGISVPHGMVSVLTKDLERSERSSSDPAIAELPLKVRTKQDGAILITHAGLSGPAVLKASAWGARDLHDAGYRAEVQINWIGMASSAEALEKLKQFKEGNPRKALSTSPLPLPSRLWKLLVDDALGSHDDTAWAEVSNEKLARLSQALTAHSLSMKGKAPYKEEFVTCGGVRLSEVDFRTMQSKRCPGLFLCGELLDVDAVTGGFNFQAAWTTGWIAGSGCAAFASGVQG